MTSSSLCSFIVSTFHRPRSLAVTLASLAALVQKDIEVWVADNSSDVTMLDENRTLVEQMDRRFHYLSTGMQNWCLSANEVFPHTTGDWVGFPSDDSYYPPLWLNRMLTCCQGNPSLILSSAWMECLSNGWYNFMPAAPKLGNTLKGGFLVRRELFPGFFTGSQAPAVADGLLAEELVKQGAVWAAPYGVFFIQN